MAATQSLTVTVTRGSPMLDVLAGGIIQHAEPLTVELDWGSDASGDLNKNVATVYSAAQVNQNDPKPTKLRGYLAKVVTIPDGSPTQPSAAYDVYLKDPNGIDMASADLINRSNSTAEQWVPTTVVWIDHEVNLVVANAGDGKGGKVVLYMVP